MRNAKLIRVMSGAENVLERQTSRGLTRVGAIFTAANRLISKDMAQHMGLSAAHKLCSCQLELKQLANEVLDALWQLRGLTKQVPAQNKPHVPHTNPHSFPCPFLPGPISLLLLQFGTTEVASNHASRFSHYQGYSLLL